MNKCHKQPQLEHRSLMNKTFWRRCYCHDTHLDGSVIVMTLTLPAMLLSWHSPWQQCYCHDTDLAGSVIVMTLTLTAVLLSWHSPWRQCYCQDTDLASSVIVMTLTLTAALLPWEVTSRWAWVSSTRKSATLLALTLLRGEVVGAFKIVRSVGRKASSNSCWLSLKPTARFPQTTAGSHCEHRFSAPSSKLCQIWLHHSRGTLYLRKAVHRCSQHPLKGLGTDKTVEAT